MAGKSLPSTAMRFGPYVARAADKLGAGNFGTVLGATHSRTGERVAIKLETIDQKRHRLPTEFAIYRELKNQPGFPRVRWFGRAHGHLALVLDLLGPSLRTIHRESGMTLSTRSVRHVAEQALKRLETFHSHGWLHCDVKPANLLLPRAQAVASAAAGESSEAGEASKLNGGVLGEDALLNWRRLKSHEPQGDDGDEWAVDCPLALVDFGLSRRWLDPETGEHLPAAALPPRRPGAPVGTGRYASLSNHEGAPLSRRDDLESLAFSLIYLRAGHLPWIGLKPPPASKKERFAAMLECKRETSLSDLSDGLPSGFEGFLQAVRRLEYGETPDYGALRGMARAWADE